MFVLEALTLTFMTTPAVTALYPPHMRVRASGAGANFASVAGRDAEGATVDGSASSTGWKTRFAVVLDRMEHLPGMMAVTQLLRPSVSSAVGEGGDERTAITIDALRVVEVSDGVFSGVMKSAHAESLLRTDPLLGVFRTYGDLHDLPVSTAMAIVGHEDLAGSVADHVKTHSSQMVILPWLPPWQNAEASAAAPAGSSHFAGHGNVVSSSAHAHFVRGVFAQAACPVALFVDRVRPQVHTQAAGGRYRLLLPFFGGPDDRLALDFVVQLCADPKVSATVLRMSTQAEKEELEKPAPAHLGDETPHLTVHSTHMHDTVYGHATTETRLQSATADDIAWARYTTTAPAEPRSTTLEGALARVEFEDMHAPRPLHAVVARAEAVATAADARVYVVAGRARRLAVENHGPELQALVEEHGAAAAAAEVRKTVGDVATALVAAHVQVGLLVLQASLGTHDD
jgi:hypothetical protein